MAYNERLNKADVSISSSGDNTIIAAPSTGQYIAIDHVSLLPTTAVAVQFKDGTTAYGGAFPLGTLQALVLENSMQHQDGVITLSSGQAFVINLGSAVQVGGIVRYRIIN